MRVGPGLSTELRKESSAVLAGGWVSAAGESETRLPSVF